MGPFAGVICWNLIKQGQIGYRRQRSLNLATLKVSGRCCWPRLLCRHCESQSGDLEAYSHISCDKLHRCSLECLFVTLYVWGMFVLTCSEKFTTLQISTSLQILSRRQCFETLAFLCSTIDAGSSQLGHWDRLVTWQRKNLKRVFFECTCNV